MKWIGLSMVFLCSGVLGCKAQQTPSPKDPTTAPDPVNQGPKARIDQVGSVHRGEPITFLGEGSSDPDDDTLSFAWQILSAPNGADTTLTRSDQATATFTPELSGSYSVQLVVTDPDGLSDTTDRSFTATARVAVVGDDYGDLAGPLLDMGYEVEEWLSDPWSASQAMDGDNVVWIDRRLGVSQLRLHNLTSGDEQVVVSEGASRPSTQGDLIAWIDTSSSEVFAYRISSGQTSQLTSSGMVEVGRGVQVFGDRVAYTDRREDSLGEVYVYDVGAGSETRITTTPGQELETLLGADSVFWRAALDPWTTHIYRYRFSDASTVQVDPAGADQSTVSLNGDWLSWVDIYNGVTPTIRAYQLSTGVVTPIGSPSLTWGPVVAGGRVAYTDATGTIDYLRNVRLADPLAGTDVVLTTAAGAYQVVFCTDDLVGWLDTTTGPPSLTVHRISAGTETVMDFRTNWGPRPAAQGDTIVWADTSQATLDLGLNFWDIWLSTDGGSSSTNLTPDKPTLADADVTRYDAMVFGPGQTYAAGGASIALFDAAISQRVPVFGLGTGEGGTPLVEVLAANSRFGLSTDSDDGRDPMEIDVTSEGAVHPIFDGIDTSSTLILSETGGDGDEQKMSMDTTDPNAPADYKVLARLGPGMHFDGSATIVSFSMSGVPILLDGSALSHDDYELWNGLRWNLFLAEVQWLAGPAENP